MWDDALGYLWVILGVGTLFGIPAWAAYTSEAEHRWWLVAGTVLATAAWCWLCLWLALR